MFTNTQIRNALTGALAIMAFGVLASCSESLVAPADDTMEPVSNSAVPGQGTLQECTVVDGIWVCGGTTTSMALDNEPTGEAEEHHCEIILGVLHCPPDKER